MERVGYTWALGALAVSGLFLGIMARKPTMVPAETENFIQEGDDLIISCCGDDDIQFSFMDIPYHDGKPLIKHSEQHVNSQNDSELNIKYFRGSADGGNYSSQVKNLVASIERYMNIIITAKQSHDYIIWISSFCVWMIIIVAVLIYVRLKVKQAKYLKKEFQRMALSELDQQPYDDSVKDENELIHNNQESFEDHLIRL